MDRITYMRGDWSGFEDLIDALLQCRGACARRFHERVEEAMTALGFVVVKEWAVAFSNGQGGRVDVVAFRANRAVALELDNRSPRQKSVAKLRMFPKTFATAVILRDPKLSLSDSLSDTKNSEFSIKTTLI